MNDIRDALIRIADTSAPGPLALDDVRRRARRIRRRRTATALVASAAAVATIAGLGVALRPSDSRHDSVPPAAQTPSPTPTTTPTRAADADAVGPVFGVTLDTGADQTSGAEPGVPYWFDGNIVRPDGSLTPLADRPLAFTEDPASGGWVVLRAGGAHAELVRVTDTGRQIGPAAPSSPGGLAVGPDGDVATLTGDSTGWTLSVGSDTIALPRLEGLPDLDGFLPGGDVLLTLDGVVRVADVQQGTLGDPRPGALAAVASPAVPFVAEAHEDGSWAAVGDDGSSQWSVDWAGVNSFSPDGRYVVLVGDRKHRIPGSTDWDSEATGTLWVRDARTLAPVAAFTAPKDGYFWGWAWDGDELLATVFTRGGGDGQGEWSLVRLSADGFTVGRASGRPGAGEEPAYVFATR